MGRIIAALVIAAAAVPGHAAVTAGLASEIANLESFWQAEADGARRHPTTIAYEGRATVTAPGAPVLSDDTWSEPQLLRLSSLSPDADPTTNTSFTLRGQTSPIKLRLLNDAGVDFRVAELAPFGTDIRFSQGAVGDLYFGAVATAASQAFDGNLREAMIINKAGLDFYPARAPSGREGALAWQRNAMLREARASAFDPTTGSMLSTTLVAAVDAPLLRVVGGDLTTTQTTQPIPLDLPEDVTTLGGLTVTPGAMPGVRVNTTLSYPNGGARDFHAANLSATATPDEFWPESRDKGRIREWTYRPLALNYGIRRSAGATGVASFDVPLPLGASAVATSVDGSMQRIGPVTEPSVLHVVNVDGRQSVSVVSAVPPQPEAERARQASSGSDDETAAAEGAWIRSPEARGHADEGAVAARIVARNGVPVVSDIVADGKQLGATAFPGVEVDGVRHTLTEDTLVSPLQVSPFAGRSGAGFVLNGLFEAGGVLVEVAIAASSTASGTRLEAIVIDAFSADRAPHDVAVLWYSRPAAAGFAASGARVPVEAVVHVEFNGGFGEENQPTIDTTDSSAVSKDRYFVLAPALVWQANPNAARSYVVLAVDEGGPTADPLALVDGEELAGEVAFYESIPMPNVPPAGIVAAGRTWLTPLT